MLIGIYSLLLALVLALSAPVWLWRMLTSGRYREGLSQRVGMVPAMLRAAVAGKQVIWVHAVSVGEALAAERMIAELQQALPSFVIAISTTTATGQKLARERFAGSPVFFYPLDFAFAVRAYLRVLRPSLVVLVESEFWPRMLVECERAGVPVAVVNARVSDRSFPRYMRLRRLWKPLLGKVSLFLAQSEESAERLRQIGAPAERVSVTGNLKYDARPPQRTRMTELLRAAAGNRAIVVAGSTVEGRVGPEEQIFLQEAMRPVWHSLPDTLLILAPRHPQRFAEVADLAAHFGSSVRATELLGRDPMALQESIIVLDTLGDLASAYGLASVAFVGGSLVSAGGHNPLEPAQFGVPVIMGSSYENFRDIVDAMRREDAIMIADSGMICHEILLNLLGRRPEDREIGMRAQRFSASQGGSTERTVEALSGLMRSRT